LYLAGDEHRKKAAFHFDGLYHRVKCDVFSTVRLGIAGTFIVTPFDLGSGLGLANRNDNPV